MIKLVAIDLDGTLVNDKKELSLENIEAIKKAKEKGVYVILATGRPIEGLRKYYDLMYVPTLNDYACTFNGAVCLDVTNNKIIHTSFIKGEDVHLLAREVDKFGLGMHILTDRGCITPKNNKYIDLERSLNGIPLYEENLYKYPKDKDVIKFMIGDEPALLDAAIPHLPKYLYKKYNVVKSATFYLEFLNKECDKWIGIEKIAEHLGITKDEIMCIGDADNDLGMISNCGFGVAMENAFESVKKHAKFITKSNNESGVAYAINKFINEK